MSKQMHYKLARFADHVIYNRIVPTPREIIMQTVNVRQLKTNPSVSLREAKGDMVIVMNRDQPTAVLVGMEQLGGVADLAHFKLALAMQMFRQKTLSVGSAAKFAGKPLGEMLSIVSAAGLPVVDYPAQDLASELASSVRFEKAAA